jgi:CheY-like chemotaxis protein
MATDGAALRGQRVLVAEDQFIIALDLAELLRGFGCTVLGPAGSTAEVEALLGGARPDLALVSDAPAPALLPKLRAHGIPAALLTAYTPDDLSLRGHDDVPSIGKPYSETELRELLLGLVASKPAAEPTSPSA